MTSQKHKPCLIALATLTLSLLGCSPSEENQPPQDSREPSPEKTSETYSFVDIAAESGLDFTHWNGMTGELYFIEPVGSGGGLADLDNDGDLDIILIQGRLLDHPGRSSTPVFPPPSTPGTRIFRNDLTLDENGAAQSRFVDITEESGVRALGYGMGVASGDYDNDGRIDLYITNFGENQLWRNVSSNGEIRFEDVTVSAAVGDDRWSTSASFADLNADGWLDLFVANYVDFRLSNHKACRAASGRQDFCGPSSYNGESDRLFLNQGDGTFRDITTLAGMSHAQSSGLGVVAADFDMDGKIDLYVANDQRRNFLWRNLGEQDGLPRFEETAMLSGTAVSMDGRSQASMGVVAGDIDNDGDPDLFMTHLRTDTNTLYMNDGTGFFQDRSAASGLGAPSLAYTSFGTALVDFDNDGWLDLLAVNGEVRVIEEQAIAGDPYPLKQINQIFRNIDGKRFSDITDASGMEFSREEVTRGIAVGDIDNNGASDFLFTNNNGPARLLQNRNPAGNWIGLRVLTAEGRDALGARVRILFPDGQELWRRVATDGSYLSANDPRLLIGLGQAEKIAAVEVKWVDGSATSWEGLETGRYHTLSQDHRQPQLDN